MPVHDWMSAPAAIFHDFRHEWISTIHRSLNAGLLPSNYYALAEQIAGGLGPEILTLANGLPAPGAHRKSQLSPNRIEIECDVPHFVATPTDQDPLAEFYAHAKRNRVVIREASDHRVIAMIEILAPRDKMHQQALDHIALDVLGFLDDGIHLLILDLIPPGPLDPNGIHPILWDAIGDERFRLPVDQPLTLASYFAGQQKPLIKAVAIGESLPDMPLFLSRERNVIIPLETTYQAAWDRVPRRWRNALTQPTQRTDSVYRTEK